MVTGSNEQVKRFKEEECLEQDLNPIWLGRIMKVIPAVD